ncbi:MAG: NlpBDapX lipoprotein [Gallionellales bacterium GWA2_60_18]|nr:MAG: NlpBDapX lipoprotein [Gallionellales bacterium GWA2_60_18]
MKVPYVVVSSVLLVMLAGCSEVGLGSKRIDYKAGAEQAPSLEVPPDLTMPVGDSRYKVTQGDDQTVATYSDYSKRGGAQPGVLSAVLPEVKGVRLERDGARRWLVVNDKPENVWAVLKTFWQENNLPIVTEDAAGGVMETEWVENRAKIPLDFIRKALGKAFDDLYSSGERDKYRTRLERNKDGVSTDVYITHYGKEEVMDKDKITSKWQDRPNDPEMESIMLQRLMVRFGSSEDQAANALVASGAAKMPATSGAASMREGVIVVEDTFDRVWRRVGLAIEDAGLEVEDRDRVKGIYFLRPPRKESGWLDALQFWKDGEDSNKRYRVNVKDGGTSCAVNVTDLDGTGDAATGKMLEAIYKNINQ